MYKIFGWWYRWQACKMAAEVMSGRNERSNEGIVPLLWSVTVFFEMYLTSGSEGTIEDFGPKEPIQLKDVNSNA